MELSVRQSDLLRELQLFQGIVERKNTIPILGNVLLEANGRRERRRQPADARDRSGGRPPQPVHGGDQRAGVAHHPREEALRDRARPAETEIRIQQGPKGAVEVAAAQFDSRMQTLPSRGLPHGPEPGSGWSAVLPRAALGEMVAKTQVRDHGRGHALLPQRGAAGPGRGTDDAGRHRRSPAGAGRRAAGGGREPARRRRGAARDPAEEDARGARAAVVRRRGRRDLRVHREPSLLRDRRPAPHLADDRRPVPRLRAGDPAGQRQADRVRAGSAAAGGPESRAALERAFSRNPVPDRHEFGGGEVEQPRGRRGQGGARGRVCRRCAADLLQRPVRHGLSRCGRQRTA